MRIAVEHHAASEFAGEEQSCVASAGAASVSKKERRRRKVPRWNSLSYTTRMTLSFAFIAAMTALVAIGVMSFVWEQHFHAYTTDNMKSLAEATADDIARNYNETGDLRAASQGPAEAVLTLYAGVGLRVVENGTGTTLFDSTWMMNGGTPDEFDRTLAPPNPSQMAMANIEVDNRAIGSVRIWVYGSDTLLRQTDQEFRDNSYQALMGASLVAIVLASCMGFLFARNLVSPINRMTRTARAIKEGDLSARTNLRGEDEVSRLGETFDEMAETMEKDRELERRLTTDVAHELRTPLMAIQSTVEAMVDGVFAADEERLETVNSEVQRLSRLVDALLKLARLENRSTPLKEEVVDVGELIAGIIATHEAFVAEEGLTLEYHAEPQVRVVGDADMIRQATANLISNAVRYTPEGGRITVSVRQGDVMASIAVRDTGIGLSADEAKMVFSRFWRADAGRNRASGGLGVGLSVVKEIVDRHGGWVQVEGQKGEGACFTIHIPRYDEDRVKAQQRAQKQQKTSRQQKASRQSSGISGKIMARDRKK